MKFGLYNENGLVDICHDTSEKKARATFKKWYGLSSLKGWKVWALNDEDGWYTDNYDAITSSAQYKQRR
jgi:hypothetical protein